ncbi:MAG: hypothetical protein WA435_00555 [Gallionellaceae bacterium]
MMQKLSQQMVLNSQQVTLAKDNPKFDVMRFAISTEVEFVVKLPPVSFRASEWPNRISPSSATKGSSIVRVAGKKRCPAKPWAQQFAGVMRAEVNAKISVAINFAIAKLPSRA